MPNAHSSSPEHFSSQQQPVHQNPDLLSRNLKRGHDRWRIVELKDRIKFFKNLEQAGMLTEEFIRRRDAGRIDPGYDNRSRSNAANDTITAKHWQKFEIEAAEEIIRQIENNNKDDENAEDRAHAIVPHNPNQNPLVKIEQHETEDQNLLPEQNTQDIQPPNKKGHIVDASEIMRRMAWSQAEEKLNAIKNAWRTERAPDTDAAPTSGLGRFFRGVKNVGKNIAHTTLDMAKNFPQFLRSTLLVRNAEPLYLDKFYRETLAEMQKNKNLYAEIDAAALGKSKGKSLNSEHIDKNHQALDAIVEQYMLEVAEAEERGETVNDPDVNSEVSNLFYEFAVGGMTTRQDFDQAVHERIIPILKAKNKKFGGDGADVKEENMGLLYASNLFELANTYKGYISTKVTELEQKHGAENKEIIKNHVKGLMALDIQLGLKQRDIRETKPKDVRTAMDKFVDNVQSIPVLGRVLAMPASWGAAAGATAFLAAQSGARFGMKTLTTIPVVGGLFGATLGAWRRGRDLQYDRGLELRRQALGQAAGGRNAAEMRQHSYDMADLAKVNAQLDQIIAKPENTITPDDTKFVAEMYARLALEQKAKVDLFSSDVKEGSNLGMRVKSMTELKVRLKNLCASKAALAPTALQPEIQRIAGLLENHVASQDSNFKDFRFKEQVKAGVFGGVMGAASAVASEALFGAYQGKFHQTSVGRLKDWMMDGHEIPAPSPIMHAMAIPGSHINLNIPQNMNIVPNSAGPGLFDLVDKTTGIPYYSGMQLDATGSHLATVTINNLKSLGASVIENPIAAPFGGALMQIPVPGHPEMILRLPAACNLVRSPSGVGYDLLDNSRGTVVAQNLVLDPTTNNWDAASARALDVLGWKSAAIAGGPTHVSGPADMLRVLREKYGDGTNGPGSRNWHGNIDTRSRQVTSLHNPYYDGKITGGARTGYAYEYSASADDASASAESVRQHILDNPVAPGEKISGSIVDGAEKMLYFRDDGDEYVLDFTKAMKHIMQHGARRSNTVFDHKFASIRHIFKGGNMRDALEHLRYRVFLTSNDLRHHGDMGVDLKPGSDGMVHIHKGSEMAKIFIDTHGKLRAPVQAILKTGRSFAQVMASKPNPGFQPFDVATAEISLEPPTEFDCTIAPAPDVEKFIPFVPLPFVPRWAMERGKSRDKVPNGGAYYYSDSGDAGWRSSERFKELLSPRLKENSQAILNEQQEIDSYVNKMDSGYRADIEQKAANLPPLERDCRATVCIPAYKEGERIYDGLKNYLNQKKKDGSNLDPKLFEIIIFDNNPTSVAKDKTEDEVNRFKREHPEIRVHYLHEEFAEKKSIGYYRKVVSDVALKRMATHNKKYGPAAKEHILVSNDADFYGMGETYFDTVITAFDKNKKMDAFGGLVDYPKEAYEKMPLLMATKRLWMYYDLVQQTKVHKKSPGLTGPSSGFRASMYAAVGGYNENARLAEDLEMGNFIKDARDRDPAHVCFLAKANVFVDPRRGMATLISGRPVIRQYDDWTENESIRDKTWKKMASEDLTWAKFDKKRFLEEAQAIFDIYGKWDPLASRKNIMERAMHCMGAKIEFVGEKIKLIDTSELEAGLQETASRTKPSMQVKPTPRINRKP